MRQRIGGCWSEASAGACSARSALCIVCASTLQGGGTSSSVNLHGSHLMDVVADGKRVHPHAEHRKSLAWLLLQGIFERYHHGFK